jgi:hypothetical protein
MSVSAATVAGAAALLRAQASTIDADWAAMSRVARDAAYNCGKAVPESAQIVDGWIKASADFRAPPSCRRLCTTVASTMRTAPGRIIRVR